MRLKTSLIFFAFLSVHFLQAQTFEYGGGIQVYLEKGKTLTTFDPGSGPPSTYADDFFYPLPTLDIEAAYNFPFLEREGYSLGFQPGLQANGMLVPGFGLLQLATRGDVFVTVRLGAQASYANFIKNKRYLGMGGGGSFYEIVQTNDMFNESAAFFRPSVFIETGKNYHKFKLFILVGSGESHYKSYIGKIPATHYWQFGFSWTQWIFTNKGEE